MSFLTATLIIILVALIGGVIIYFVYDASINEMTKINQIYAKTNETIPVEIYFCPADKKSCNCDSIVTRRIKNSYNLRDRSTETTNKLLEGPTAKEKERGYTTNIPEGTKLLGLDITNGVANVNFSSEMSAVGGSSCQLNSITSSVKNTLSQFSAIKQINILVNGNNLTL